MDGAYTVLELTEAIKLALNSWLPNEIWVQGEMADLSRSAAGHAYFQLVEPGEEGRASQACISVTLLDSARQHVNAVLRQAGGAMRMVDGTRIRIRGRLELYEPKGRLQLRMSGIDPSYTLGLLLSERDRVLRALTTDGLIECNRARPLPDLPLRLGLVTRRGSAAMADFLHELDRSRMAWRVTLLDTPMQGTGADAAVASALRALAAMDVDAIALVRGGGARTDLAAFDSELLGRTIAELPVPVLTGIGHEIDRSVADEVAHSSHKTPTACAAALVAHVGRSMVKLVELWSAVVDGANERERQAHRALQRKALAAASHARRQVDSAEHAMARDQRQLARDASTALSRARLLLDRDARRVKALDPVNVMARGWSMTRTPAGSVIRGVDELQPGDDIVTVFADGEAVSQVSAVTDHRSNGRLEEGLDDG